MTHPTADVLFPLLVAELKDYSIFTMNLSGEVQSWNRGAEQLVGFTEDEIIGRSGEVLFTSEDIAAGVPRREIEKAITTGRAEDNRWHVRKDGSRFFAGGVTVAISEEGSVVALAKITRDATERRLTETQAAVLSATSEVLSGTTTVENAAPHLLRLLCEHLGWHIGQLWVVRNRAIEYVATWTTPGSNDLAAAGLAEPLELHRGEGLPGHVWETGQPEWIVDVAAHENLPRKPILLEAGIASGLAFPVTLEDEVLAVFEFFLRQHVPPEPRILDALSLIGKQLGQFIRRRAAEDELRRSEEHFRVLSETASDVIISIDEEGRIVYTNPAVERLTGRAPSELIGVPLESIVPDRHREPHREGMKHYLETGERRVDWRHFETQVLHKDGREIDVEMSFSDVIRGGRRFFTAVLRDITERKEVDSQRLRTISEVTEASRVKDEFLAMVSHELRTPMTAVLGWVRLLKMGADEETTREAVDAIERSASAQAQLIDDMLDVSRIAAGKLRFRIEPTSLTEVVATAVDTVRIAANARGVEIHTHIDESLPQVPGDRARLQQVIWNLLTNAVKFTHAGGRIDVTLQRAEGFARIEVKDTGEGIPPDFLPHVFERFRQAETSSRRSHGGLGLGLSIVKNLVESHGGRVHASSEGVGKGAVFVVELPFETEAATSARVAEPIRRATDELPSLEGLRVLLVEDDDDTRSFLQRVIERAGASVKAARSAVEALSILDSIQVDVLVSDLAMPVKDGYDLIRHVRERRDNGHGRLPAVAVTASGAAGDRERALEAGFDEYVRKPVDPPTLVAAIRRGSDQRKGERRQGA